MGHDAIVDRLRRPFVPEELAAIGDLGKAHSMAEDARDLAGLMATLTADCVYELVPTGHRWEGHAGATASNHELLGALSGIVFDLTDIVIGPQVATGERALANLDGRALRDLVALRREELE